MRTVLPLQSHVPAVEYRFLLLSEAIVKPKGHFSRLQERKATNVEGIGSQMLRVLYLDIVEHEVTPCSA